MGRNDYYRIGFGARPRNLPASAFAVLPSPCCKAVAPAVASM
jgi:hypothetical protein